MMRMTILLALLAAGCHQHGTGGDEDLAGGSHDLGTAPDLSFAPDLAPAVYADFPAAAVVDPSLPTNISTQFGASSAADAGAGPCVVEPTSGALVPQNWTPLYIEWTPGSGQNVFEVRLHVDNQTNDLVAYTPGSTFTMDATVWSALALDSADHDVAFSVRGAVLNGTTASAVTMASSGTVHIAPVPAAGSIVYWTTSSGTALNGFSIGDTMVKTIVTPALMNDGTGCVGCHTSSPDGKYTFLSRASNTGGGPFNIDARTVDGMATKAASADVSAAAFTSLARTNQTLPALSAAHYVPGDHTVISTLNNGDTANVTELVWTDLDSTSSAIGTGTGILSRGTDKQQAALPQWAHDGNTVAYVSSTDVQDGRTDTASTDLFVVPYNNRMGGDGTPVPGASDPSVHEFYPVFSPDDAILAFDVSPSTAGTYNEPTAEVNVIPPTGGIARRLTSNDAPACTGQVSPGLTNSWPRWAPQATTVGGKTYYWLVFSSTRRAAHPQLYVAGLVVDSSGATTDYPALWISAQPAAENNHTPAWDNFKITVQ